MVALDHLERAKTIHTEGMMKGKWNKKIEKRTSQYVFQSQSHPNFTLTFTKAYLVEISEGDSKKMYHYFWDPILGYLCERRFLKGEGSLSVEILKFDINDSISEEENVVKQSMRVLQKEISAIKKQNEDLKKELQSLQYICESQERTLFDLTSQRRVESNSGLSNESQRPPTQPPKPFIDPARAYGPNAPKGIPGPSRFNVQNQTFNARSSVKQNSDPSQSLPPSSAYDLPNQNQQFQLPTGYQQPLNSGPYWTGTYEYQQPERLARSSTETWAKSAPSEKQKNRKKSSGKDFISDQLQSSVQGPDNLISQPPISNAVNPNINRK